GLIFDYAKKLNFTSLFQFLKWQSEYNNQSVKNTILLGLQQRLLRIYLQLLKITKKGIPKCLNVEFKNVTDICLWHFTNGLQTLLRYEDRNSMAFSLESRLPFLDYRLVEFIFSLSVNKRFRKTETKWILRKAMKNINIDSILERKDKIGFATPEQKWWGKIQKNSSMFEVDDLKSFIFNRWIETEKISWECMESL
ncbi:MAG: asparagine synthase-related protein, partial [Proteobacteria bacterium]|nr:asparagine synthase-related protein [Pseudomonadota bacterium]